MSDDTPHSRYSFVSCSKINQFVDHKTTATIFSTQHDVTECNTLSFLTKRVRAENEINYSLCLRSKDHTGCCQMFACYAATAVANLVQENIIKAHSWKFGSADGFFQYILFNYNVRSLASSSQSKYLEVIECCMQTYH